jgi:hypothetical protein
MPIGTPFKARSDLDEFRRFLGVHNRRLTVPGVAVELSRLIRFNAKHGDQKPPRLWMEFIKLMRDMGIDECHVPVVDLRTDDASIDGPVDVALCALARAERARHHEVLVVTSETRHLPKWMDRSESSVETLPQVMRKLRSRRS